MQTCAAMRCMRSPLEYICSFRARSDCSETLYCGARVFSKELDITLYRRCHEASCSSASSMYSMHRGEG